MVPAAVATARQRLGRVILGIRIGLAGRYLSPLAVTQGEYAIRSRGDQGVIQPASNGEATLRDGAWSFESHLTFGMLEGGGIVEIVATASYTRIVSVFLGHDVRQPKPMGL
jgi:hypothetical protein